MTMNKKNYILSLMAAFILFGCDAHKYDAEDHGLQPKQILCSDGKTYSLRDCQTLNKKPFAVVFYKDEANITDGAGYAVYLWDINPECFADSIGVIQKTSSDLNGYDGMGNTYELIANKEVDSPMAASVYSLLPHGQQAFIPSVAEMRLLHEARDIVNPIIKECGGDPLPIEPENSWYWTSTEVKGHETLSAWLYSLNSGLYLATLKTQEHKIRPIVMLRY